MNNYPLMMPHDIVGIKLSHDAAVACIGADARLKFSIEMEKVASHGDRYTPMRNFAAVEEAIRAGGKSISILDDYVIDGWKHSQVEMPSGEAFSVSPYHEFEDRVWNVIDPSSNLRPEVICKKTIIREYTNRYKYAYKSYSHVYGHIVGAYAMSPFAQDGRRAAVVVWDGGVNPRLYFVDPSAKRGRQVEFSCSIHQFYGTIYGIMGYYFGPYKDLYDFKYLNRKYIHENYYGTYEWPGKLMSYIAHGKYNIYLASFMKQWYASVSNKYATKARRYAASLEHEFMSAVKYQAERLCIDKDADVLLTIHEFLKEILMTGIKIAVPYDIPVIFTGGSALNIKWNSALANYLDEFWVSPVPNDSGSAIGTAVARMIDKYNHWHLNWDVYCGPAIIVDDISCWNKERCSAYDLGKILATNDKTPIIVLAVKAEIGPRALGHRSIMMSPSHKENQNTLNHLKCREAWRPVAPICLTSQANRWFSGDHDPYMLYDHEVKQPDKMPAITHIDGTARLQTVDDNQQDFLANILRGAQSVSGIPVLCNTSANAPGKGFFSSLSAAAKWAEKVGVEHIWCNGTLYSHKFEGKTE